MNRSLNTCISEHEPAPDLLVTSTGSILPGDVPTPDGN
jgi:hypothetical protein